MQIFSHVRPQHWPNDHFFDCLFDVFQARNLFPSDQRRAFHDLEKGKNFKTQQLAYAQTSFSMSVTIAWSNDFRRSSFKFAAISDEESASFRSLLKNFQTKISYFFNCKPRIANWRFEADTVVGRPTHT